MDSCLTKECVESSGFDPKIGQLLQLLTDRVGCGEVLLAGGAIRDLWLGGKVKDYDVYVHTNQNIGDLLRGSGMRMTPLANQNDYAPNGYSQQHLTCVWESLPDNNKYGLHIQLIFIDIPPVWYVLQGFDFDICKAWWDPETYKIVVPNMVDYKRVVPTSHAELSHAYRIQEKYPWVIIDDTIMLGSLTPVGL